jgi:hypothetical protein
MTKKDEEKKDEEKKGASIGSPVIRAKGAATVKGPREEI